MIVLRVWRPCGPAESAAVRDSGWTSWARPVDRPYLVLHLNDAHAEGLARRRLAPRFGSAHVLMAYMDVVPVVRFRPVSSGRCENPVVLAPVAELRRFEAALLGPIEPVLHVGP